MGKLEDLIQRAQESLKQKASSALASVGIAAKGYAPLSAEQRQKIALMIAPAFRGELAAAYKASGLKRETSELFEAAVDRSRIIVTTRNIVALMPSGMTKNFYAKAGALQYGAARSKAAKKLRAAVKSKRASAKKVAAAFQAGGSKTHAFGYFTLDAGAVARITARYQQLVAMVTGVSHG